MSDSRSKNASRNIGWGFIYRIVTLITPFITRIIIIKELGSQYLGLSSLFVAVFEVLNLAELGFSNAIIYSMYKPVAENDIVTINRLLNYFKRVYRYIGIIVFIIGFILIPFLPFLINGTYPGEINIYILYILYLVNTSVSYVLFAYKASVFEAYQRNDIQSIIISILNIVKCVLQISTLIIWNNFYGFVACEVFITVLRNIIIHKAAEKLFPDIKCEGNINIYEKNEIRKQVSGLMVQKVCAASRNSFDSIFISAFIGLTSVAMYNNYYYVMHAAHVVLLVITTAMQAGVGNSVVSETVKKNYDDMNRFIFIYAWLSGIAVSILLSLYQPFMRIWVGEALLFDNSVAVLFSIYLYSLTMGDIYTVYYQAAGLWWEGKLRAVLESIVNLFLNYFLVQILGIHGIILATLISVLVVNFGYGTRILYQSYLREFQIKYYYINHFFYSVTAVISAAVCYYVCHKISFEGILGLFFKGIICICITNVIWLIIWCRTGRFKDVLRKFYRKVNSFT